MSFLFLQVELSESNTVYIEQIIYIFKSMLDAKSDEVTVMLGYMPIEDLILPIIKYESLNFLHFQFPCCSYIPCENQQCSYNI